MTEEHRYAVGVQSTLEPAPSSAENDVRGSSGFARYLALGALVGVVLFGLVVGGLRLIDRQRNTADRTPLTDIEVGFLHDMIDHHRQAIEISNVYLAANPTGGARYYASEVAWVQQRELDMMAKVLTDDGKPTRRSGDVAMAWMGHGMPVAEMTGMQSPEALAALAGSRSADADTRFFAMMADHHQGGIEMMTGVLELSKVPRIVEMATWMRSNQRVEIVEYGQAMRQLGLQGEPRTSLDAAATATPSTALPAAGPTTTAHNH
jgi:uncharacterized protein (DUF305 family)